MPARIFSRVPVGVFITLCLLWPIETQAVDKVRLGLEVAGVSATINDYPSRYGIQVGAVFSKPVKRAAFEVGALLSPLGAEDDRLDYLSIPVRVKLGMGAANNRPYAKIGTEIRFLRSGNRSVRVLREYKDVFRQRELALVTAFGYEFTRERVTPFLEVGFSVGVLNITNYPSGEESSRRSFSLFIGGGVLL